MANCETCKNAKSAPENAPYIVHEASMARMERQIKRLWIAVIVAVALLFASSAIFAYAWLQYDYESYEITSDGDSNANYIGQDGNIYNGSIGESEEKNPQE